jgi:hypothetical protein
MDKEKEFALDFLQTSIGIPFRIVSNELTTFKDNERHEIVLQILEEEPDIFALGLIFTLSLMSFTFSAPRGYSELEFIPDEEWNIIYFLKGLEFVNQRLEFYADYISGRHMKTRIVYESGGRLTLRTTNRGRGADRWITHLQGKGHIKEV